MKTLFKSLIHLINFLKINSKKRKIVFYAENQNSYNFFDGIITQLITELNQDIYYVTSSITDPILKRKDKKIKTFFIGSETIRTIFFQLFNSKIMILTMPDLNNFHIKKSRFGSKFIFIPHNIVSIHMTFRKKAFNYYEQKRIRISFSSTQVI